MKLVKVKSELHHSGNHVATRYEVFVGNRHLGYVEKRLEQSHRSDNTGSPTRWGFRGYSVTWAAKHAHLESTVTTTAYRRGRAIEQLIDADKLLKVKP